MPGRPQLRPVHYQSEGVPLGIPGRRVPGPALDLFGQHDLPLEEARRHSSLVVNTPGLLYAEPGPRWRRWPARPTSTPRDWRRSATAWAGPPRWSWPATARHSGVRSGSIRG
jgi:hypothetical protein